MADEENSKPEEAQSPDEFVRLSPSGIRDWFWVLTKRVIEAGSKARLDKYLIPGLPEEVVADQLIRNKAAVAAIIGALAGLGTSASQFSIPFTAGMTLPVWVAVALVETGGLSLLQLRMVQDLFVLYNVKLDPDDPQDMVTIFSVALGIKPSEALAPATAKMAVAKAFTSGAFLDQTSWLYLAMVVEGEILAFCNVKECGGDKENEC